MPDEDDRRVKHNGENSALGWCRGAVRGARRPYARRAPPCRPCPVSIRLAFLQFATCAAVSLLLALVFEEIHWDAIVQAGPALLYGGLLGVGTGFTLQVVAQKHAIASHAAIILSLEAVFAAIAGALFLAETLHLRGYFGCALMLAGMLVAQLWPRKLAAEARPA